MTGISGFGTSPFGSVSGAPNLEQLLQIAQMQQLQGLGGLNSSLGGGGCGCGCCSGGGGCKCGCCGGAMQMAGGARSILG